MKKLIVFSVVLALVAGVAFAQPSIGGNLSLATRLLTGSTQDGADDVTAGGTFYNDAHINVNFGNDEAGGMLRLYHLTGTASHQLIGGTTAGGNNAVTFTYAWWKPIEQFRLQLGQNPDGDWGAAQVSGWGYNAEAQAGVAIDEWQGVNNLIAAAARNSTFSSLGGLNGVRAFAPGFSALGLTASIYPMDELAINLGFGLPFSDGGAVTYLSGMPEAKAVYGDFYANIKYDIEGTGTLRISFDSGLGSETDSKLYASFFLTMIDGMGIDIGLGYALFEDSNNQKNPLAVGLGFRWADGDLGVKARLEAALAGDNDVTTIGIGVLPSYNIGNITVFANIGLGVGLFDGDTYTDWFFNPYLRVRAANGVQFYAGLKVAGYDKDYSGIDGVDWAVPIQIRAYF